MLEYLGFSSTTSCVFCATLWYRCTKARIKALNTACQLNGAGVVWSAGPSHSHNSDDRLLALVGTCLAGMELSFVATGEKEGRIRSRFVVDVLWIRACVKGAALVLYGHCSMINDA